MGQQTIILFNVNPDLCHHLASLGHNGLTYFPLNIPVLALTWLIDHILLVDMIKLTKSTPCLINMDI